MASEPEVPAGPAVPQPLPPVIPGAPPPPLLPPVIPASTPDLASGVLLQGRLHPLTLLLTVGQAIRNFFIPLIIVLAVGRGGGGAFFFWVMAMVGLSLVYSLVRYFTFSYRIENGELVTTQGLLGRLERKIPLTRVQDVRIEQSLVQRLLQVVELQVETAGGQGAEASLAVLSFGEAERLRQAIFTLAGRPVPAASMGGEVSDSAMPPVGEAAEVLRRVSLRELVYAGLTSNYIASALVLLLVLWHKLDDLLPASIYERLGRSIEQSLNQMTAADAGVSWPIALGLALGLLAAGMVFSVAGSVALFYGFTLSRCGEDVRRVYGLFTRRASNLPRRRLQVLKIDEPWLRRLFGLATLRADTAGSAPQGNENRSGGRDVLLPIARRQDLEPLLPALMPALAEEPAAAWQQVSRRAVRRGTMKGAWLVLALVAGTCAISQSWNGLWLLGLLPVVYYLNVLSYRHLGYRLGPHTFWARQGWLSRTTHIVPIRNAQAVVVTQTPLDRWHKVASVLVDTAGQASTGGGPHLANIPREQAVALARELAQKAAAQRFRW